MPDKKRGERPQVYNLFPISREKLLKSLNRVFLPLEQGISEPFLTELSEFDKTNTHISSALKEISDHAAQRDSNVAGYFLYGAVVLYKALREKAISMGGVPPEVSRKAALLYFQHEMTDVEARAEENRRLVQTEPEVQFLVEYGKIFATETQRDAFSSGYILVFKLFKDLQKKSNQKKH